MKCNSFAHSLVGWSLTTLCQDEKISYAFHFFLLNSACTKDLIIRPNNVKEVVGFELKTYCYFVNVISYPNGCNQHRGPFESDTALH